MNPEAQPERPPPVHELVGEDLPPRNEFWILPEAKERLEKHFPDVLLRLQNAAVASGFDNFYAHYAAEHVITAEALVEILEANLSGESPKVAENELASELRRRVVEKVEQFGTRSKAERETIKSAYAEIDPERIAVAYKHGLIRDEDVVWALQQTSVYFSEVLVRLGHAGLLSKAEMEELNPPPYLLEYVERTTRGANEPKTGDSNPRP